MYSPSSLSIPAYAMPHFPTTSLDYTAKLILFKYTKSINDFNENTILAVSETTTYSLNEYKPFGTRTEEE